jgi:hypothetical protein
MRRISSLGLFDVSLRLEASQMSSFSLFIILFKFKFLLVILIVRGEVFERFTAGYMWLPLHSRPLFATPPAFGSTNCTISPEAIRRNTGQDIRHLKW